MHSFHSALGSFKLQRQPPTHDDSLRAWDAADELLLQHLQDNDLLSGSPRVLILNDQFGALACALHANNISIFGDSFLSQLAIAHNYSINHLDDPPVFSPSTARPPGTFDLVLIKVPKVQTLLEHQLIMLGSAIHQQTLVIAAGMVKYLQKKHFDIFEKRGGPVTTSLAHKKARLLFVDWQASNSVASGKPTEYTEPVTGLTLSSDANVFSRSRPDPGSRLILENLTSLPEAESIIDMGCGNGILGIAAKCHLQQRDSLEVGVTFVDESFMALNSARRNASNIFGSLQNTHFVASDCFDQVDDAPVDLVLCNPPFHQANAVGDHIAWKMITGSKRRLRQQGKLWLVGNRHLHYQAKLKKVFGNCSVVASNPKFVLLAARQTAG